MANKDLPVGFKPSTEHPLYPPHEWPLTATQTIAIGDMVILDSAGRVSIAAANSASGLYLGVAASSCKVSTAGDPILVYDNPDQVFQGQCSGNGALADPYTTRSFAACFDIEGTTGIMEINEDSSSYDVCKIVGVGLEPDGTRSAAGANQKKLFQIARGSHVFGTLA